MTEQEESIIESIERMRDAIVKTTGVLQIRIPQAENIRNAKAARETALGFLAQIFSDDMEQARAAGFLSDQFARQADNLQAEMSRKLAALEAAIPSAENPTPDRLPQQSSMVPAPLVIFLALLFFAMPLLLGLAGVR